MISESNNNSKSPSGQPSGEAESLKWQGVSYSGLKLSFHGQLKEVFFNQRLTYEHVAMVKELDQIGDRVNSFNEFLEEAYGLFKRWGLEMRAK